MSKVLILTNSLGGLYSFRKELIEELNREGYKVSVSAPKDKNILKYFQTLNCEFINTYIDRRSKNIFGDFKLLVKYFKIIKDQNPNIVLTYTIKPNIYGGIASRFLGKPYIANITGLGTAVEKKSLLQKLTLKLYKFSFKKISKVFFQNEVNQSFFQKNNIALGKHEILPGSGVNLKHYYPMEYPAKEKVEFLFIARIVKEKGIEQYLKAAEYIKSKYPNTVFHVLGDCDDKKYLNILNRMQGKNIIIYHGKQKDILQFHKHSFCTIHPTYYPEGMSNVLLESAACGKPIITTDRSGCREIVDDGINGYLIKQENSIDLIEKIEKFLNLDHNTKKSMGLAGRKKVENHFDRQIVINAYLKSIEEEIKT